MRILTVLFIALLSISVHAAPKKTLAKLSRVSPKPQAAGESFYIVTCTSQCLSTPKSVRLTWSDGWTSRDAKKLQRDLERTCVSDLREADCKRPMCSCSAKLAAKAASQPASRPATTQPMKLMQAKKARGDDLPPPSETKVEATP